MKSEVMAFPWTLPFGLMAWNFVQSGLRFSDCLWSGRGSCCEDSGPVKAAEASNRERSKELGWWKGPLLPNSYYQWPFWENAFLLPLTPAAFFGAHLSATPQVAKAFWSFHRHLFLLLTISCANNLLLIYLLAAWVPFALLFSLGNTSHSGPAFVISQWSHVISSP